jgi:hypothetical protein
MSKWAELPNEWFLGHDEIGFFAGLKKSSGVHIWRSLSTPSKEKAKKWLSQAVCHGVDGHHSDCYACKEEGR